MRIKSIKIFWMLLFAFSFNTMAQQNDTSWKHIYRASYPKINDLVHTKLVVNFDYNKQWMYGREWVTLHPHFYPTDSLTLDAKGMEIKEIALIKGTSKIPLKFSYDDMQVRITLDKTYKEGEKYTLYLSYISKPNERKENGIAVSGGSKGLYFINPKGETNEHVEIWTQGEAETNSVWFPTIDKPDQKTTQEILMTVPAKYVTLSNGLLVHQKKNADGTRTDDWKMDLPNAPYLFFMGVGDYVIVKDHYKNIPVDYYVEKKYASVARKIFGETPAIIDYFSRILKFPYAWPKYDQIVGREYIAGAMENTTATLHSDVAYQNARQLVDENRWENTISHELFHHWFGDLATCESWSNITVNESFARYGEYLWAAHHHGKDAADDQALSNMRAYLASGSDDKDLVRFYYKDKGNIFDVVSYNKGAWILGMLRNYVGDSAFFKSLNKYLNLYKFKSTEAQQLRLAFEDVTGQDLNWFWNQWYYGSGQPTLDINYNYSNGRERVIVDQVQNTGKLFKLPVAIDVYSQGANKKRYKVCLQNKADTFYFASAQKPSLINVDADKILLCKKTDHKSAEEFEQQYKYAPNYLDRREALDYFVKNKLSAFALGLNDKYSGLRLLTLYGLDQDNGYSVPSVLKEIEQLAAKDPDKKVQAKTIEILANLKDKKYLPLFKKYVDDSSYSVAGAALQGLTQLEPDQSYPLAKKYSNDALGKLGEVVFDIIAKNASEEDFHFLQNHINSKDAPLKDRLNSVFTFATYLSKIKNPDNVKNGVDEIMKFRIREKRWENYSGANFGSEFQKAFNKISAAQRANGNEKLADYVDRLLR